MTAAESESRSSASEAVPAILPGGRPIVSRPPKRAQGATSELVLEAIGAEGPLIASEISTRLGIHLTTVLYHLRRLERDERVVSHGRLWALPGQRAPGGSTRPLGPSMRRALVFLSRDGPLDHASLATRLGVSRPAVTALVQRLALRGLVHVETRQRRKLVVHRP